MPAALESVAQGHRELASAVKRLRVAVMTDPGRAGQLADALVGLVGNRLLAWSWAEAATEAPESVVQSARILAAGGPVGPYADLDDAVRYFTASVQLAMVQAGLGQVEAAGRTLDALDAWRGQLGRLPVIERLTPVTVVRALTTRARAGLAQDVAQANAYADAALLRMYATRLDREPSLAYLLVASHLVVADARWAAGHPESALAHHRLALVRYRALLDDLDGTPRPALVQLALAPLAELYQPYALRLEATGDPETGLAVRREWLALLEHLAPSDPSLMPVARAALGGALSRAGRDSEAAEYAAAMATAPVEPSLPASASRAEWTELAGEQALAARALTVTATFRLRQDEQAAMAEGAVARKEAEADEGRRRAVAEQAALASAAALAEAEHRASAEAEAAARESAERERVEAEAAADRRATQQEAERAAAEERRRELAAAHEQPRTVDARAVRQAEADLPDAREALSLAGEDPEALLAAQEHLAELLRPLALADPAQHCDELAATLEALVSLRWRLGDADGSREAARELKAL